MSATDEYPLLADFKYELIEHYVRSVLEYRERSMPICKLRDDDSREPRFALGAKLCKGNYWSCRQSTYCGSSRETIGAIHTHPQFAKDEQSIAAAANCGYIQPSYSDLASSYYLWGSEKGQLFGILSPCGAILYSIIPPKTPREMWRVRGLARMARIRKALRSKDDEDESLLTRFVKTRQKFFLGDNPNYNDFVRVVDVLPWGKEQLFEVKMTDDEKDKFLYSATYDSLLNTAAHLASHLRALFGPFYGEYAGEMVFRNAGEWLTARGHERLRTGLEVWMKSR